MLDISDLITVRGDDEFILKKELPPGKEVSFRVMWRGKMWRMGGFVAENKRNVHLTLISSR